MVWACVAGGAVRLLLGLWFRVPALIAASGITAALCLSIPHLTELSTAGMILALLSVLQVGYPAGLRSRVRDREPIFTLRTCLCGKW